MLQPLQSLARFARRRYHRIFWAAGVLAVLCFIAISRLEFKSDVLDLLPQDDPIVETFRDTLTEFGGVDLLLVVVGLPEGVATDPYQSFAVELGSALEALDSVEYADYRIGEMEELVESYLPSAFFLLDAEGRALIEQRLSDEGMAARVAEVRRTLATPQSVAIKQLLKLDPLGLSDAFMSRISVSRGAVQVDLSTGFFLSADRRLMLLLAKPVKPAQDVVFTRQMIDDVNEATAATLERWSEIAGDDAPALPTVRLGGNYVTALGDDGLIRRDVIVNSLTSLAGVLLLFLLAFRRVGLLVYAFLPLALGLVAAYGFTAVTVGELNIASAGFAALLVGLGIDFIIVSYGRYVEERSAGKGLEEALATMGGSTGRAVVVGGVTSAATFYAFASTEFVGLKQMGFLTGTGILLCMASVLLLLPAMLAWREDHHSRRNSFPKLVLHGFGSTRLIHLSLTRPRTVLLVGLLITVVFGGAATQLRFEDSIAKMRPEKREGSDVEAEVAQRFGSGFDFMMLVLSGESLEEVLDLTADAGELLDQYVGGDQIVRYESISSILPPRRQQEETLLWIEQNRELLDSSRVEARFAELALVEGMRVTPFQEGLDLFARAAAVSEPISLDDVAVDDSSRRLLGRFVRNTSKGWKSIVYLYPPAQIWKRDPPPAAFEVAEALGPRAVLSGVNVISSFLRETVKRDALVAAIVGFLAVALLLWLDLRRPLDTLLCLVPLLVGILWMLGAMSLFDLPMNFFNIFVTTMIIGIGVDYGIHMIHRYRESSHQSIEDVEAGLAETGKAVVLAAASTMVGFGSLSFSAYPGLQTMGIAAILGAFATALVAITLLPAYLSLRLRRDASSASARD